MGVTEELVARAFGCPYGYRRYGNVCRRRSNWYFWGRWVVVGVILVVLFVTLLCCLITARRRRRRGATPYYGTGWMANGNKWSQNNQNDPNNYNNYNMNGYNNQQQGYGYGGNPPPAYGQQQPQYTGSTFNPNDGYYGQQSGVQSPPAAYRGNDDYAPPTGPPPGK